MKTFKFKVELIGTGNDLGEAWDDAVNGFALDPGLPDPYGDPDSVKVVEDDEKAEA